MVSVAWQNHNIRLTQPIIKLLIIFKRPRFETYTILAQSAVDTE